jgi:hypothetical protein
VGPVSPYVQTLKGRRRVSAAPAGYNSSQVLDQIEAVGHASDETLRAVYS